MLTGSDGKVSGSVQISAGGLARVIGGTAVVTSYIDPSFNISSAYLATNPGATLTLTSGVGDPLAGLVTTPTGTDCPNGGGNPTIASHTPDPAVTVYYPGFYSISSPTYFPPGRYFFCGGLEVKAGGSIEGSNLFISVRNTTNSGKGLFIDPGATVNALAQTSGQYKGILLWISGNQPLDLGLNGAVSNYGGLVYTPNSVVTLTAASSGTTPSMASNIAGLVAQQVKFTGSGTVLLGPTPTDISLSPTSLPNATAGQNYAATITAPGIAEVRWSSVNLPAGLSVDNSGQVSGTPTCSGIFSPELAAFDASGSAAGAAYDGHSSLVTGSPVTYSKFSIAPGATLANPGTPVKKGVTLNAVATNCSGSTKVAFQSAPTGTSTWTTICNNVSSLTAAFSCSWSPADGTYDLRVQATDAGLTTTSPTVSGITVDGTAPTIGTITPAAGATMSGSQAVTAVVADAGSGLASVTFSLSGSSGPATCTGVLGSSNTYSCNLATGSLTNGSYTLTVTATDNVGNVATKSQSNTVTNSGTCGIGAAPDVQACNGTGTVGKIETGDKIVLAYAAAMSKTTILSGWTTDPKNIFVRVRDNNNQETVDFWTSNEADSDKQVYLGSIDIGKGNANDFMNKDTTVWFNASMTMSSDGTTITITLGAFNSGTSSNLKTRSTTGTLVWTPDSHAKTTGNVAVSTNKVNESGAADIDF